jgi:2-polyprenyl-3-methyl-5-hydroxy-6-metoxy-1,4-benzoquinol methylase
VTEPTPSDEIEALNDRLAREHPIDDYYEKSPLPIRLIEKKRLAIIRDMVGPSSGQTIAEVGSGGGHVLRMFRDAKLTAIDVSQVYLDTARTNLHGYDARFVKGEVDKLVKQGDLAPESFDRIICTEVLEHTENPELVLEAIAKLLKKSGVAVITVPNDPLILRLKGVVRVTPVGWILGRRGVNWGGDEFHIHQWTPSEFRELLERYFRITDYEAAPSRALPIRACFRCLAQ